MQSRKDAAPKNLTGLRAIFLLTLSAAVLCAAAFAAPLPQTLQPIKSAGPQLTPNSAENVAGSNVCAGCHEEVVKGFVENPHARLTASHPTDRVTCESCHGSGKAHVDSHGDKTKIFNPATASTHDVDGLCLDCHQDRHPDFDRSAHANGNVSCLGCHDIHQSKADNLLKASQPTLCYQCHDDTRFNFALPYHHKVNEGLVQCSDCHDVHGAFERTPLKSVSRQNAACVKCHTETAGPWSHEHSVVKSEGCVGCHTPHGGTNPRLLNRADVNAICLQCHSPSPAITAGTPPRPVHGKQAPRQPCKTCHLNIHGSNTSKDFLGSEE
jgi:DmsE family decaheme c-type cytochrome